MKPMIWHPEEKDSRVSQYLDQTNHAPYETIAVIVLGILSLFTLVILLGTV